MKYYINVFDILQNFASYFISLSPSFLFPFYDPHLILNSADVWETTITNKYQTSNQEK